MGADLTADENRAEKKKRETRKKIVHTAFELFEVQGFHATTMEQIAEKVDIARKTLYNHFPEKEAILDEYAREISQRLAEESRHLIKDLPDTRSQLKVALQHTYSWVELNAELTGICLGYRMKKLFITRQKNDPSGTYNILLEIVKRGQQSGDIKTDIPEKLLAAQLDFLRGAVVMDWLDFPSGFDLQEAIARLVDLFLDGAGTGSHIR